jgi:hypothetical protein
MNTSTRYRITLIAALFLAIITITAVFRSMEMVAATSIAGIMTILSAYIWSQTQRPTQHESNQSFKKPRAAKNPPGRNARPARLDDLEQ